MMMLNRRDLVSGLLCAVTSGGAAIGARKHLSRRYAAVALADLLPVTCGAWHRRAALTPAPEADDSLSLSLYSAQATTRFVHDNAASVSVFLAYGPVQDDARQIHRPEECYPAAGYDVRETGVVPLVVRPALTIPLSCIEAEAREEVQHIGYWVRIGDRLAPTAASQRLALLRAAASGTIEDGLLVRCAVAGGTAAAAALVRADFIVAWINSLSDGQRAAVLGRAQRGLMT